MPQVVNHQVQSCMVKGVCRNGMPRNWGKPSSQGGLTTLVMRRVDVGWVAVGGQLGGGWGWGQTTPTDSQLTVSLECPRILRVLNPFLLTPFLASI